MRKYTLTALIVGVLAVTALGIWWAPSVMHRDTEVRGDGPSQSVWGRGV